MDKLGAWVVGDNSFIPGLFRVVNWVNGLRN